MTRFLASTMLLTLATFLHPSPAHAESPNALPLHVAVAFIAPHVCNDRDELAGVLMVEGGNQPTRDIIRMAQILMAEADSRGLTLCALTHLTNFTTVRNYANAHPNSYAARQLANPPEWMLDLAGDVLTGRYEDMRNGYGHWDGSADGMSILFKP